MSLFVNETPELGDATTVNGSKIPTVVHEKIILTASSATDQNLFIAPVAYKIVKVYEIHGAAGGTSSAVQLEVIHSGTANGSGTTVLASALILTGTANTVQSASPATSTKALVPAGSRIGVILSGTLTGLTDCLVEVTLQRV